ncbi:MAG TPA: DUF131 domain-containing protein [Methanomassiliicoccales archaeon]|jgi:uncharacterized protein (TIGR00304 family)
MRSATVRGVGIALLIVGLVTTAWTVYSGLTKFYLVVIVPVFASDNAFGMLPLLAIFAGIVLIALAPAFYEDDDAPAVESGHGQERPDPGRAKVGGVVLIGPIPILFGTDKKMALMAAGLAIVVLAIIVLFLL